MRRVMEKAGQLWCGMQLAAPGWRIELCSDTGEDIVLAPVVAWAWERAAVEDEHCSSPTYCYSDVTAEPMIVYSSQLRTAEEVADELGLGKDERWLVGALLPPGVEDGEAWQIVKKDGKRCETSGRQIVATTRTFMPDIISGLETLMAYGVPALMIVGSLHTCNFVQFVGGGERSTPLLEVPMDQPLSERELSALQKLLGDPVQSGRYRVFRKDCEGSGLLVLGAAEMAAQIMSEVFQATALTINVGVAPTS